MHRRSSGSASGRARALSAAAQAAVAAFRSSRVGTIELEPEPPEMEDLEPQQDDELAVTSTAWFHIQIDVRTDDRVMSFEQPWYPADGKPAFPGKDVIVALQREVRETFEAMYPNIEPDKMAVIVEWRDSFADDDDGSFEFVGTLGDLG